MLRLKGRVWVQAVERGEGGGVRRRGTWTWEVLKDFFVFFCFDISLSLYRPFITVSLFFIVFSSISPPFIAFFHLLSSSFYWYYLLILFSFGSFIHFLTVISLLSCCFLTFLLSFLLKLFLHFADISFFLSFFPFTFSSFRHSSSSLFRSFPLLSYIPSFLFFSNFLSLLSFPICLSFLFFYISLPLFFFFYFSSYPPDHYPSLLLSLFRLPFPSFRRLLESIYRYVPFPVNANRTGVYFLVHNGWWIFNLRPDLI